MGRFTKTIAALVTGVAITAVLSVAYAQQPAKKTEEKKPAKFNVGYLASTGHIMYFIAQEKGYFKDEGLNVELFQFNNSGEGINSIISGKLDAGSFGTAPPFTFIEKGQPISIFGGQMYEGHALIAKPEKAAELKELKNFKGKKIAGVRLATGDIVFRYGFSQVGIDPKKDLTINEYESPAAVVEVVKKGEADAGVVWTPFRKMAEQQGLVIVQYSGNVHNMKDHPCCRQIAVTDKLAKEPEKYKKFLAALIRAYDFYKTNEDESLTILAKYVKVDREILKSETYGQHIGSNPDPNKEAVVKFWGAMKTAGYITSDIDIAKHVNTSIYASALNEVNTKYPGNKNYEYLKSVFKP